MYSSIRFDRLVRTWYVRDAGQRHHCKDAIDHGVRDALVE